MLDMNLNHALNILTVNGVDFTVTHGLTNHGTIQPCLLAQFPTATVRLVFTDTISGGRLTQMHIDGDHSQKIAVDEFYRMAEQHRVHRRW